MELESDNFAGAEAIFSRALMSVLNVQLWTVYLNYVRRRNDLTNDVSGEARKIVSQAYDFVLATVGIDPQAGKIWQEYLQFVRSAPGQIGGSGWQDKQKMDQLRSAYQKSIIVPMSALNGIWKEYDQFEMGLNKNTVGSIFIRLKSVLISHRVANSFKKSLPPTCLPEVPTQHWKI